MWLEAIMGNPARLPADERDVNRSTHSRIVEADMTVSAGIVVIMAAVFPIAVGLLALAAAVVLEKFGALK